jgi:hypothetical protein
VGRYAKSQRGKERGVSHQSARLWSGGKGGDGSGSTKEGDCGTVLPRFNRVVKLDRALATGMVGASDSACSRSDGAIGSVKLRAAEGGGCAGGSSDGGCFGGHAMKGCSDGRLRRGSECGVTASHGGRVSGSRLREREKMEDRERAVPRRS